MDCKTKEMTSYQRLRWELKQLNEDLKQERQKTKIYENALWKIAKMRGPQVTEAPETAFQALYKQDEIMEMITKLYEKK